jgi:hypothetical protein
MSARSESVRSAHADDQDRQIAEMMDFSFDFFEPAVEVNDNVEFATSGELDALRRLLVGLVARSLGSMEDATMPTRRWKLRAC